MLNDDTNRLIEEALEGRPRASELASMVASLEERRDDVRRELISDSENAELRSRVKALDQQILALREELAITDFVESSVRAAAQRPGQAIDDDEWFG